MKEKTRQKSREREIERARGRESERAREREGERARERESGRARERESERANFLCGPALRAAIFAVGCKVEYLVRPGKHILEFIFRAFFKQASRGGVVDPPCAKGGSVAPGPPGPVRVKRIPRPHGRAMDGSNHQATAAHDPNHAEERHSRQPNENTKEKSRRPEWTCRCGVASFTTRTECRQCGVQGKGRQPEPKQWVQVREQQRERDIYIYVYIHAHVNINIHIYVHIHTGCLCGLGTKVGSLLGLGTKCLLQVDDFLFETLIFTVLLVSLVGVMGTFVLLLCNNSAYIPRFCLETLFQDS